MKLPLEDRHAFEPEPVARRALAPAKPRWDLVPWKALEAVVRVLMMGCGKYPTDDNWKKVPVEDHKRALLRHVISWSSGDATDTESGESHLAHAVCRALFIIHIEAQA